MKSTSRQLFYGAILACCFTLALAVFAQETPKPVETKSAPAAERAPAAPPAPAIPEVPPVAAPVAPAAPIAPAEPIAPAVEAEKSADTEKPLRRLDVPADADGATTEKTPASKRRRSSRTATSDGPPFGDHIVSKGNRVREAISIFGSTTVEGEVETDTVSVLGRTFIGSDAKVGGDAVAVLGPLESKGRIGKDAVSVFGGVDIDGPVGGEVVSVFGDMRLGPNAVIERDIVLIGGKLTKDPQAIVRGNQVNVPILGGIGDLSWLTTWVKRCVFLARPLAFGRDLGWAWLVGLSLLGFYALLALLFRGGIEKCVTTLETRPGMSLVSSVLTVLLSPVVIVLLVATVIGVVIVPFLAIGLMFAGLFGKTVMLAWLGRRFTKFFGDGPLAHPVFAVLIGGVAVLLLYTVPVFGFLLYKLLSWVGLGVVVYTIALALKREKPPVPVPSGPIAPPSAGNPFVAPVVAPAPAVSPGYSGTPSSDGPAATMGFAAGVAELAAAPLSPPAAPPVAAAPMAVPVPAASIFTSAMPRAGFFIRLAALALDAILIGMIFGFTSSLLPRFLQFNHGPGGVLLGLAIYGAVMWKNKGTTIGGIVCGLKVVRIDNREIDWATAIVRALGCFLSMIVAGLGFIWVAFDYEKQSWHDKIAGTTVVRVPKGVSLL